MNEINYKFKEKEYLEELTKYIDKTYTEHYAAGNPNNVQALEVIFKHPDKGLHFCIGSIQKYSDRQGYKVGEERKDILKIIHYGLLALYNYDNKKE